jgi:hypothetical protein
MVIIVIVLDLGAPVCNLLCLHLPACMVGFVVNGNGMLFSRWPSHLCLCQCFPLTGEQNRRIWYKRTYGSDQTMDKAE